MWITFGSVHEVRAFRERKKRSLWFRVAFEVFLRKKDNFYEYPKEVPYSRATYIIIEIILEQDAG